MSTLTLINSLPLVTLTTPGSQLIINETSTNNTLSRITVGNFLATLLPEGVLISNPTGTLAVGLDLSTLFTISSVGSDGLGTLTLAPLSSGQVLGNPTGGTAAVQGAGLSLFLDSNFGSIEGDILYRGSAGWLALPAGTAGNVLTTDATAGPPSWQPVAGGSPWQITDGTHTVTGVVDLIVPSGGVSASGTGTAHLVFPGGSGSLELVQGTTTLAAVSTLTLTGSGGTLTGSGASGTLNLSGGGGGGGGISSGPVFGINPVFSLPDLSIFTTTENGGAAASISKPAGGPIVVSQPTSGGSTALSTFLTAAPTSSTWTITCLCECDPYNIGGQAGYWPILIKGSSFWFGYGFGFNEDYTFASRRIYDSLTDVYTTNQTTINVKAVWFRVVNNGSQILFQVSPNKINFITVYSENLGDFSTILGVGFGIDMATSSLSGSALSMSIWDWEYSTP